ncbi:MAG: dipicolinate synthase subunit B [Ruminococcaceae bacterium]|nr:dipicolinate synthase subunit B [Oscillospiraceae bacterium]
MLGYAFCGSFCTHARALEELQNLISLGYDIQPILSETVWSTDTRFGTAKGLLERVEEICSRAAIHTVVDAEPLGPRSPLECLIISPCTGNTLAKIANGITDTAVCMAAKAHLRSDRPLVISLASNDALSANLKNIATLLSRKQVYFVPMMQDDPEKKPHSLVADFSLLLPTLQAAFQGRQFRKLFL